MRIYANYILCSFQKTYFLVNNLLSYFAVSLRLAKKKIWNFFFLLFNFTLFILFSLSTTDNNTTDKTTYLYVCVYTVEFSRTFTTVTHKFHRHIPLRSLQCVQHECCFIIHIPLCMFIYLFIYLHMCCGRICTWLISC